MQEIWKNAQASPSNILFPGSGSLIAGVKTAASIARTAGSVANISGVKFAEGGQLFGASHAGGGIRGTGSFSGIEVEGGEFITNRRATQNNAALLESINAFGDSVDFGRALGFATGGTLPNTTPTAGTTDAVRAPTDNSAKFDLLTEAFNGLRADINKFEKTKQVVVNYTDIEDAGSTVTDVRDY